MTNDMTTLFACSTLFLTFNDIYLIIVGISILVSTVLAIYNALKSGKQPTIDTKTQEQLKDIDKQLSQSKDQKADQKED